MTYTDTLTVKHLTDTSLPFHIQEILTEAGDTINYRITRSATDDRIGTCFLLEHAQLINSALNGPQTLDR